MMPNAKKYVVVTTDKRGVFAGFLASRKGDAVNLTEARMCVYWSREVHGVVGLSANGPTENCRVSPASPEITLVGITSVMTCSDEAREAWESEPWKP